MTQTAQDRKTPLKVLFIAEKWCAGIVERGIAEWETNHILSFKESIPSEVESFPFDEYYRVNKKQGDEALLQKIKEWKPDMIVLITNRMPDMHTNVPKLSTLAAIKNDFKIPLVAIFGDLESHEQEEVSKAVLPYVTVILATASEAVVKKIKSAVSTPEKYVYMWVPKNPKIFNDPRRTRDIGLSYYGSWKENRPKRVHYLIDHGVPVIYGGGEGGEHLTTEKYAEKFQRSKISLGFARGCYSHMTDARPFEAMLCGSMVLEEESAETPKLFIPFVDYVPYWGNKDLVKKAKYYLEHDEEREKTARNGREKMEAQYSAKRFWEFAVDRAFGSPKGIKDPVFVLSWSDLSLMPKWRAVKLKFIDALCSTELGFKLYYGVMSRVNKVWLYRQLQRTKIGLPIYRRIFRKK